MAPFAVSVGLFLVLFVLFAALLSTMSIRKMLDGLRTFEAPGQPAVEPTAPEAHRRAVEGFEQVGYRVDYCAEVPVPPGAALHLVTLLLHTSGNAFAEVASRPRKPPRFGITSVVGGVSIHTQMRQGVITMPSARKQVFPDADPATLHQAHSRVLEEITRRGRTVETIPDGSAVDAWVRTLRKIGDEHPTGVVVSLRALAIAAGRVEDDRPLLDVPEVLDGLPGRA